MADFELLVMLAARLGPDEAYTVTIAEDTQERTGRAVRRANVFTALVRLEEKGLILFRRSEAPDRGGRPPRLVTVEPAGATAVRPATQAIRAMVGDVTVEQV